MTPRALLGALLGVAAAASLPAQSPNAASRVTRDVDAFVSVVRDAVARYRDRSLAVRDGYRPLGPDAPGMGQHWVNVARALSTTIDAARPAVLTYVDVHGVTQLVGAALLVTLDHGAPVPAWPDGEWHTHDGDLEDEGLGVVMNTGAASGPRVAILHVWALHPNPDGMFATNNWSLPFTRAAYVPPEHAAPDAARAIALLTVGMPYYVAQLERAAAVPDSFRTAVTQTMATARARVVSITETRTQGTAPHAVPDAMLQELARIWRDLLTSLDRLLPPGATRLLAGHGKH